MCLRDSTALENFHGAFSMTQCWCQLIHLCDTTLLFLTVARRHPLLFPSVWNNPTTAPLANQTKRGTEAQKSSFTQRCPSRCSLHAVFPGFCWNSAPCRHPLAIRPYLQCLFSKFGRSERWEQALDLLSNPCSVTMAAQGDSHCHRPEPNLAGGIFSPPLSPAQSFSPQLHNSAVACVPLVLPWGQALLSAGASLEGLHWRLFPRQGMKLIHGFVIMQHKKPEQKVPTARRCPHGSDPKSLGAQSSHKSLKFITKHSGIQLYQLWPKKNPSCCSMDEGIVLQLEFCRKREFASPRSTTVAQW
ncbi:uncharacterized protein LOC128794695 [Vidua chalybeata]|uniref:uncharacterized protein LOC128794695 n=1 Tax=Vidua chalybeata TaxID=81927 RepID=UPI0023A7E254|nr:uncharacterized protein LOC128794695 [Vidua chalybeata]